jgi:hypothetical protein
VIIGAATSAGGDSPLEISSTNAGVLLPRLPQGDVNNPTAGMLLFDSVTNTLKYYDGTQWVAMTSGAANAGQVKIDGYFDLPADPVNVIQVEFAPFEGGIVDEDFGTPDNPLILGTLQYFPLVFDTPTPGGVVDGELALSDSPTTSWPPNIASPEQTDIYDFDNDTFVENPVLGQTHIWRISLSYIKKNNLRVGIGVRLTNRISGFQQGQVQALPIDGEAGSISFIVVTIADQSSLPPPLGTGIGYEFEIGADAEILQLTVDSVTRISLQK